MANPAATPADVSARWLYDEPIPAAEKVQAWLDAAWRELVRHDATIATRLASTELAAEDVADVVVAMTLRVLGNPQGKRQESIDDYSWTRDAAVSSGALYVTPEELASLAVAGARTNSVRLVIYGES